MTLQASDIFSNFLNEKQAHVETCLANYLPPTDTEPARLHAAMRYACLGGGKRIRPLLVYASASLSEKYLANAVDAAAIAVEMIHCYSLIHDDLPAMDDDTLRRGRPTCHIAFDEATAILAGDALQALAFEVLSQDLGNLSDRHHLQLIHLLAQTCGVKGMAGGQALDLYATGTQNTEEAVRTIHKKKTGALIKASVLMGATCAGVDETTYATLEEFSEDLGLAFQIQDDILDIEGHTHTLGKSQGADTALKKLTYPSVVGLAEAKIEVELLYNRALKNLTSLKQEYTLLKYLSEYMMARNH